MADHIETKIYENMMTSNSNDATLLKIQFYFYDDCDLKLFEDSVYETIQNSLRKLPKSSNKHVILEKLVILAEFFMIQKKGYAKNSYDKKTRWQNIDMTNLQEIMQKTKVCESLQELANYPLRSGNKNCLRLKNKIKHILNLLEKIKPYNAVLTEHPIVSSPANKLFNFKEMVLKIQDKFINVRFSKTFKIIKITRDTPKKIFTRYNDQITLIGIENVQDIVTFIDAKRKKYDAKKTKHEKVDAN